MYPVSVSVSDKSSLLGEDARLIQVLQKKENIWRTFLFTSIFKPLHRKIDVYQY